MENGSQETPFQTQPLIHVGYPKAGSTWLQKHVFCRNDLGFSAPWGEQAPQLIEDIKVTDTFLFDEKIDDIKRSYEKEIRDCGKKGLVPVLSFEHIMLDPYGGKADRRESVRRLQMLFPDAKIFLMIREQKSAIMSSYSEHLRRGFTTKIDRFMGFDELRRPGFGASCPPEGFLYDRLISYLHENFGKNNVLVLPIEMLGSPCFEERLFQFVGKEIPPEFSVVSKIRVRTSRKSDLIFLRHLNYIGTSRYISKGRDSYLRRAAYGFNIFLNYLTPKNLYKKKRAGVESFIHRKTSGFYTESNKRTSNLIGIDLSALGYET